MLHGKLVGTICAFAILCFVAGGCHSGSKQASITASGDQSRQKAELARAAMLRANAAGVPTDLSAERESAGTQTFMRRLDKINKMRKQGVITQEETSRLLKELDQKDAVARKRMRDSLYKEVYQLDP